jgi:hypothetical protein
LHPLLYLHDDGGNMLLAGLPGNLSSSSEQELYSR